MSEYESNPTSTPCTQIEEKLIEYRYYLQNLRALAPTTIHYYCLIASQFLTRTDQHDGLGHLPQLTSQVINDFICEVGKTVGRRTLLNVITSIRSLLRFFTWHGEIPAGLDKQIDTPRVHREEQLPRALAWETVCALLESIDRSTPIGTRDYAMLLLIATYGLRASEVVSLKLDDINWKENRLQIFQHKTARQLLLPLTDDVGESIIKYLRQGRPVVPYREIFVKHKGPDGILKPINVTNVFNRWSQRSGLSIAFQGPHCLRHSYAVHLLRQGVALKTIGDILGHSGFNSTCVYLRLNIEDLRTVPLNIPIHSPIIQGEKK